MELKLSRVAQMLSPSPIQELSLLAQRYGAINLAVGFPDFPAPPALKAAAISVINSDFNQYSPHNPTGKIFSKEELEVIAGACRSRNCIAITDEVYEYITFDVNKHVPIASLHGMQERTIITSSLSKTFSISGWRIGWACAPANIASAISNIHVKLTDSAPGPFQEAAITALKSSGEYFQSLKTSYEARRDYAVDMLSELGLRIEFKPQGSIFVFAELPEKWLNFDVDFVRMLIEKAGVAAVPGCSFFHDKSDRNGKHCDRFVRFAFCKSDETLRTAARRFQQLAAREGLFLEKSDDDGEIRR